MIVAHDIAWHENLPHLFPHADAKSWFEGNDAAIAETAFRNGTLMGGYLIMAARALGLDSGPMSGFDKAKVDASLLPRRPVEGEFPGQSRPWRRQGPVRPPAAAGFRRILPDSVNGGPYAGARKSATRPRMRVLAIDTALSACSVAVLDTADDGGARPRRVALDGARPRRGADARSRPRGRGGRRLRRARAGRRQRRAGELHGASGRARLRAGDRARDGAARSSA